MQAEQVYIKEVRARVSPHFLALSPGDLPWGHPVTLGPSPGLGAQTWADICIRCGDCPVFS